MGNPKQLSEGGSVLFWQKRTTFFGQHKKWPFSETKIPVTRIRTHVPTCLKKNQSEKVTRLPTELRGELTNDHGTIL